MADQTVIRADDVVITGNLEVTGSQISTTTTDTNIKDRLITLNKGGTLGSNTAGIEVESGGSIEATLGYTAAGGWNFGNKNITTTGTISGTISVATDSINDTHIDFGTGTNQVNTDDLPEGSTNQYYTNARADGRADARIAAVGVTTSKVSNWDTAYGWGDHSGAGYLTAIAADSINDTMINFGTGATQVNTDDLPEGSTNVYYTEARANADIDARLATTSVGVLSDVTSSSPTSGQVLMWNGSAYSNQGVPFATADVVSSTTNTTGSVNVTDGASFTTPHVINSVPQMTSVAQNAHMLISFSGELVAGTGCIIGLQKSTGGASYVTLKEYTVPSATNQSMSFSVMDLHTGAPASMDYRVVVRRPGGATTLDVQNMSFSAFEMRQGSFPNMADVLDVNSGISPANGHILKHNGSEFVTELLSVNSLSDATITSASNNQILKYNGTAWVNSDATNLVSISQLSDVDTTGVATNKILKYNGSNWVVADDNYEDGIVNVVEDTTPQLGGDLDVNGNSITGSAVSITTSSAGNITLNPDGAGVVRILGDLTVTGSATTMDVTNMAVEDPVMLLNKHSTQPANNATDAGIMIQRGSAENNAAWFWDEDDDRWTAATTTSNESATNITETALADIQAGTAHLTATQAQYADLAEKYTSDDNYEPGTVVVIGGEQEVTQCNRLMDPRVVGVVSTAPAYLMNKDSQGVAVALRGKVPCKVEGPVRKGDLLVTNVTPGTATTLTDDSPTPPSFCVIGKSLETDESTGIKLINIIV